jgi:ABC-2 type transport system ATP-binding protein
MTERVKDRAFKLRRVEGSRRKVLMDRLQTKEVLDGVIQGRDIRLVLRPGASPTSDLEPTQPRFEDAFMDILGGGPGGRSGLAEATPEIHNGVEDMIIAKDLTKKFGSFVAVDHVSFDVKRGEIFGLLGPNGAGKSTTFRMMCGLITPTEGEARVNGADLQRCGPGARSQIGYMAQKFSLYGNITVLQNLQFFSGIYNLPPNLKQEAIDESIQIFNLKPYLNTLASELPLGYKQRLALACATMHRPRVLFLDEPTSGVDPITRREFWNHIYGLVERGVTVMITTHFMDEAEYCDRIALIYRGHVIHMDTPDALKESARSPENSNPTLEDAFIKLIEEYDRQNPH